MRFPTDRLRRLVAMVLTVGLSVCCCQAHLIAAGGPHPGAAAATDSCCDRTCPSAPDGPTDERPAPTGCQTCCIKGTGLKDGTKLALPTADVVATLALPTHVARVVAAMPLPLAPRIDRSRLRVEPPTLLRLRCALII